MVKAGDWHEHDYGKKSVMLYHTIEQDGKVFKFEEVVTVELLNGTTITGEIGHISERTVDIWPAGALGRTIQLEKIRAIHN